MIDRIKEKIREVEYGQSENIRLVQKPNIPSIFDITLTEKTKYKYDGKMYNVENGQRVFLTYDLPIKPEVNKSPIFFKTLETAVNDNLVHPFILFINGCAIKWSNIEIIFGTNYSYLVINNFSDIISTIKGIKIPYRVRYGEDNIINTNYTGNFYFDADGLLTTNISWITMRIEIISSHLICSSLDYTNGYIEVVSDKINKPATTNNIISFRNGSISDESSNLTNNGCNIFTNSGNTSGCIFKTFYYNEGNTSIDNIYKLNNDIIKNNIINSISTNYMDKLKESLSLNVIASNNLTLLNEESIENAHFICISNNKFIICSTETNNGNIGTVRVAEYIDNLLMLGSIYIFNNAATGCIYPIKIEDNKVLLFFSDISDALHGKLTVLTINDDRSIIINQTIEFVDTQVSNISVAKLSRNKYCVAYSDLLNYNYGTVQMITLVNDYTIKTTSKYTFSEAVSNISVINIDNDNTVCIFYKDINLNSYGSANIITMDDVNINIGFKYIFNSDIVSDINPILLSENRICLTYINSITNQAVSQLLDVNGNAITLYSKYVFNTNTTNFLKSDRIDDNNILVCFNNILNKLIYGILTINDNIISYNYNGITIDNGINEINIINTYDKINILFTDPNNYNYGYIYNTYNSYNLLNMKIEKIMMYNPELLESIYDELMPFKTVTYTGLEVNVKKDVNGYLTMPRRRYNNIFCYIIIFVNGELYINYNTITYINDKFKVFIGDVISNTDLIEIIFIQNVDNTIGTITIPSIATPIYLNSNFNPDNVSLFSTQGKNRIYNLDNGIIVNYNIPFTCMNNNDKSTVNLNNDYFYYNKPLTVVSNKMFKYLSVTVDSDQIDIELGDEFKYCIDKNKYMIFLNSRAINQENFELAVPNIYNPFDGVILYLNIILTPEDKIEIFYLPFELKDSYNKTNLGNIQGRNIFNFTLWSEKLIEVNAGILNKITENSFTITSTGNDCYTQTYSGILSLLPYITIKPSTTYTLLFDKEYNTIGDVAVYYFENLLSQSYISYIYNNLTTITFTTPSNCTVITIKFGIANSGFTETFSNIKLIEGAYLNGDIQIDKSLIPFGLSKNNYWYFINGKKINANNIENIGDHRLSIKFNYKSTVNFNIKQFMNPIDILSKLISNDDNWNSILYSLGSDINNFYQSTMLSNEETDIKLNETDKKATILEAFRQYYSKYNTPYNSLVYDFNDILIDNNDMDSSGNYIARSLESNSLIRVDVTRMEV